MVDFSVINLSVFLCCAWLSGQESNFDHFLSRYLERPSAPILPRFVISRYLMVAFNLKMCRWWYGRRKRLPRCVYESTVESVQSFEWRIKDCGSKQILPF